MSFKYTWRVRQPAVSSSKTHPHLLDVHPDDRADFRRQTLEQTPLLIGRPPAPQVHAHPDVLRRCGLAGDEVRVGLQLGEDHLHEISRRARDVVMDLGDLSRQRRRSALSTRRLCDLGASCRSDQAGRAPECIGWHRDVKAAQIVLQRLRREARRIARRKPRRRRGPADLDQRSCLQTRGQIRTAEGRRGRSSGALWRGRGASPAPIASRRSDPC